MESTQSSMAGTIHFFRSQHEPKDRPASDSQWRQESQSSRRGADDGPLAYGQVARPLPEVGDDLRKPLSRRNPAPRPRHAQNYQRSQLHRSGDQQVSSDARTARYSILGPQATSCSPSRTNSLKEGQHGIVRINLAGRL